MIGGLSERLIEKRKQYNLSRKVVAERIGVSYSTLADYENAYREPSLKILMKLSSLYKCSTDYLLGLEKATQSVPLDTAGLAPQQVAVLQQLIHVMKQDFT